MVSELATPLSADATIDPAMDPLDRAILRCQKMLSMLRGHVQRPEDSGDDQELADGRNNATDSPDGAVPAKCSTLGLSPNVGGVEGVDSSQRSGIISTVGARPVGAPLSSILQQFNILKLDKHTPTSCSTGVLDTDAKSTKRDTDNLQPGLVSTHTVTALLPVTTPPHSPGQPELLLARPPPWPVWMASMPSTTSPTISYTHVVDHVVTTSGNGGDCTGWLLHGPVELIGTHTIGSVTMPWDPGEKLIMPWLYPCVCCQVDIFEWIRLQQINEATMASSVLSALPGGNSLEVSLFYKHKYAYTQLDGKGTQFDFREQRSCIHYKLQVVTGMLEIFDAGTIQPTICKCEATCFTCWFLSQQKTFNWQQGQWHVHVNIFELFWQQQITEARMVFSGPSALLLFDGSAVISHVHNHHFVLENWVRHPSATWYVCLNIGAAEQWTILQMENPIGVRIPMFLHLILLQLNLGEWCKHKMIFPTCSSSYSIGMTTTCRVFVHFASGKYGGFSPRSTLAQSKRRQYFCSLTSILSTFTQTFASGDISCAEFFPPHCMLPQIVHATNSSKDTNIPDLSEAWATCENFLARPSPDFVAFCDDNSGDLIMLSISLPWDPGVCSELSTQELKYGFAVQHHGELLIFASSGDSFACCVCALAGYCDCLGKLDGAQHQYTISIRHYNQLSTLKFILALIQPCENTRNAQESVLAGISLSTTMTTRIVCRIIDLHLIQDTAILCELTQLPIQNRLHRTWKKALKKFLAVHIHPSFMEKSIQALGATWCFCLLLGTTEQGTKEQKVQSIGVQGALLLHTIIPLQQKHGGWIFLRSALPTAKQLLYGGSDMVRCMVHSPTKAPWDHGAHIGQTTPDGILFQLALAFWTSRQLTVLWLWDPGGLTSTLGLGASRNLRRGECHGLGYEMGRYGLCTSLWAQADACSYKGQVPGQREEEED